MDPMSFFRPAGDLEGEWFNTMFNKNNEMVNC